MQLLTGKEVIILRLLKNTTEMYGMEIVSQKPNELRHSSIYVLLTRMLAHGYVTARVETDDEQLQAGPKKRLYKTTKYGSAMLELYEKVLPLFVKTQELKPTGTL